MIEEILRFFKIKQKRCLHGATSWYLCKKCKKEHPEWKPFEGEGPYKPNY